MNLPAWVTTGSAAVSAVVIAVSMAGCTSKESQPSDTANTAPAEVTVDATDTACTLSADKATAGPTTFIVTNNGTKVTEFYVYGKDDRVLGEVENVSPGLQRKLVVELDEPGTYKVACKPGMVGDGIRADLTVTGASAQGRDSGRFTRPTDAYKAYVVRQTDELVPATTAFVAAIKAGDFPGAKAKYPTTRMF